MKSRSQTRTEEFIKKLEAVQLSPLEVIQRAIAMAEHKEDYKFMNEAAQPLLNYIAPKLQATEVTSESTTLNRNVDMTLDELEEELRKIEEMEKLAGMQEEVGLNADAKQPYKTTDSAKED